MANLNRPIRTPTEIGWMRDVDSKLESLGRAAFAAQAKTVSGTVASNGAKTTGDGFTSARTGLGTYVITFVSEFDRSPGIGASPINPGQWVILMLVGISTTGFTVNIARFDATVSVDCAFSFVASSA